MHQRYYMRSLIVVILVVLGWTAAGAQVAELRGQVFMQSADGQKIPLPDAQIDVFRTDLNSKYATKTNSNGEFVFAGLPFVGRYVVEASHAGAAPAWASSRAGTDVPVQLILKPGDGRRLTLDEINNSAGGTASDNDEQARKNAAIQASNQKIVQANETIARTFKAGNDALTAANAASSSRDAARAIALFTDAIAQYDEGLAADPAQPAILTNKAVALKARGVERFNLSVSSQTSGNDASSALRESAKADFKSAAEAATKAADIIKSMPAPTAPSELGQYNANKYAAFVTLAESMRLYVSKVDPNESDAGAAAYYDYLSIETDPAKKARAHLDMAQMLLDAGRSDKALAEFQSILATQPSSAAANFGAGLAMYSTGDKTKFQQAANYLQRFVDLSPDTDPLKADAKAILYELKQSGNITPKTTNSTRPRP
jgi:tetratricopeptide (TPR) repeat protein